MKNYLVKALINFNDYGGKAVDKSNKCIERKKDDEFYCNKERYEYLKKNNAVILLEIKKTR